MQAKGLFLNYKKNRRLMQYFFKISVVRQIRCTCSMQIRCI